MHEPASAECVSSVTERTDGRAAADDLPAVPGG